MFVIALSPLVAQGDFDSIDDCGPMFRLLKATVAVLKTETSTRGGVGGALLDLMKRSNFWILRDSNLHDVIEVLNRGDGVFHTSRCCA